MNYEQCNEDQKKLIDGIKEEVNTVLSDSLESRRNYLISGAAGTGKSFSTSVLINELKSMTFYGKYPKIQVCTPTHKALAVLKEMVQDDNIPCSTIHSFLNLKVKQCYKTGKQILEKDSSKQPKTCDILMIDESSMINTEIFDLVQESINKRVIKLVIWIGDLFQIPPVNETDNNPVFNLPYPYELLSIVRQAKGNPIISLATEVRKYIQTQTYPTIAQFKAMINSIQGLEQIEVHNNFNNWFKKYQDSLEFPTDKLLVAYKNATVDKYNSIARLIHKGEAEYITKGEYLVFLEAHSMGDDIIHSNNEVVQVKDIQRCYDEERKIHYWNCMDTEDRLFKVVDPESMNRWNSYLQEISNNARNSKGQDTSIFWKYYFNTKEQYQKVSYTYSCTIHKSQGSSVNQIFINLNEILETEYFNNIDMIMRLIYVGFTRAKSKLIILN